MIPKLTNLQIATLSCLVGGGLDVVSLRSKLRTYGITHTRYALFYVLKRMHRDKLIAINKKTKTHVVSITGKGRQQYSRAIKFFSKLPA